MSDLVKNKLDIELCLGSACYTRGNNKTLTELKTLMEEKGLSEKIHLHGSLCEGKCKDGPVIKINGITYTNMDGPTLIETVLRYIDEENREK